MYIRIYIYIYIYICVCVCVCLYIYICIHIYVYINVRTHIYIFLPGSSCVPASFCAFLLSRRGGHLWEFLSLPPLFVCVALCCGVLQCVAASLASLFEPLPARWPLAEEGTLMQSASFSSLVLPSPPPRVSGK